MKIDCRRLACVGSLVLALLFGGGAVRAGEILEVGNFQVELLDVGESAQGGSGTITGTAAWNEEQKAAVVRSLAVLNDCFDTVAARPLRIAMCLRGDLPANILGTSGSTFIGSQDLQTLATSMEIAWRDGDDTDFAPQFADDVILLNTNFRFHYGLGAPAPNTRDFQSVVTHEVVHALGIGKGVFDPVLGFYYGITRWNSLLTDVYGNVPMAGSTGYPDPVTVIGPEGTVYWTGEFANTTYGGNMPIFTDPDVYRAGSTLGHIAGEGGLMNWMLYPMAWDRAPDKLLLDVFRDLGWSINMDFYNAFGPVFYKDGSAITYANSFVSDYDYATAMLVSGNGNVITMRGDLEARGDFSRGLYLRGDANQLDFSGSLVVSGDYASALYVYGDESVINQAGTIVVSGTDTYGLHLVGHASSVFNSGVIQASAGAEAIRFEMPSILASNRLHILNGSVITGNIVNTAQFAAILSFGYDGFEDGNVVADDAFFLQFDDDIIGRWVGYLGGGLTILNGNAAFESLAVGSGATLGGYGTITGAVLNAGRVSPGNSIGTLTIDGDYVQTATGSLYIEAGAGLSDRLAISGTADIQGGSLILLPLGYLTDGSYEFLTAGSIIGGFDSLEASAVFQAELDDSLAGSLQLDITRNSYASLAATTPEARLGVILDTVRPTAVGDTAEILNQLDGLSLHGFRAALDDLGPGFHADMTSAALDGMQTRNSVLRYRLEQPTGWAVNGEQSWRFWSSGLTANRDYGATSAGPAFASRLDGMVLGMDRNLNADWRIGVAGAFTRTDIDEQSGASSGSIDSFSGYLYSAWNPGATDEGVHLQAALQMGYDRFTSSRALSFLGRRAQGDHAGWNMSAQLGGGYDWSVGDWLLGTLADVQYLRLAEDGFAEHGADAADLRVGAGLSQAALGTWGLRVMRPVRIKDCLLMPAVQAEWLHTLWIDSESPDVAFAGAGASWRGSSREDETDALQLRFSIAARLAPAIQAQLAYDYLAQPQGRYGASQATASVTMQF